MSIYIPKDLYDLKLPSFDPSFEENRNKLRGLVISALSKEKAGSGKGDNASRYAYYVEKLNNGNKIFITRPTYIKGFDFLIHVENNIFKNGKNTPAHQDIIDDLIDKKRKSLSQYIVLKQAVEEVFQCKDPADILNRYNHLNFEDGLEIDLILKMLKWFFIEQDITFWNYSGRGMLKAGVDAV